MNKRFNEIEKYIAEVKELIKMGNYRIELNKKRKDNVNLYKEYVIDEARCKEILMDLDSRRDNNGKRAEAGFLYQLQRVDSV